MYTALNFQRREMFTRHDKDTLWVSYVCNEKIFAAENNLY